MVALPTLASTASSRTPQRRAARAILHCELVSVSDNLDIIRVQYYNLRLTANSHYEYIVLVLAHGARQGRNDIRVSELHRSRRTVNHAKGQQLPGRC